MHAKSMQIFQLRAWKMESEEQRKIRRENLCLLFFFLRTLKHDIMQTRLSFNVVLFVYCFRRKFCSSEKFWLKSSFHPTSTSIQPPCPPLSPLSCSSFSTQYMTQSLPFLKITLNINCMDCFVSEFPTLEQNAFSDIAIRNVKGCKILLFIKHLETIISCLFISISHLDFRFFGFWDAWRNLQSVFFLRVYGLCHHPFHAWFGYKLFLISYLTHSSPYSVGFSCSLIHALVCVVKDLSMCRSEGSEMVSFFLFTRSNLNSKNIWILHKNLCECKFP